MPTLGSGGALRLEPDLPRILLAAAEKAIGKARTVVESRNRTPEDRVHDVRVALKHLRTYWRLAQPHASPAAWVRERDRLRALGAALVAFREADVAAQVAEAPEVQSGDKALRSLLKRWVASKKALAGSPQAREAALRSVLRRMAVFPRKLEQAGGGAVTWEWMEPGLQRVYRSGRRSWRECRGGGDDGSFHAWRRRVKDLQYVTDIVRFLDPARLKPVGQRIRNVAEALGDAHDLVEVRDALERAYAAARSKGWSAALSRKRRDLLERLHGAMEAKYQAALREAEDVFALGDQEWLEPLRHAWSRRTTIVPATPVILP